MYNTRLFNVHVILTLSLSVFFYTLLPYIMGKNHDDMDELCHWMLRYGYNMMTLLVPGQEA
jgi:hypothetical protein